MKQLPFPPPPPDDGREWPPPPPVALLRLTPPEVFLWRPREKVGVGDPDPFLVALYPTDETVTDLFSVSLCSLGSKVHPPTCPLNFCISTFAPLAKVPPTGRTGIEALTSIPSVSTGCHPTVWEVSSWSSVSVVTSASIWAPSMAANASSTDISPDWTISFNPSTNAVASISGAEMVPSIIPRKESIAYCALSLTPSAESLNWLKLSFKDHTPFSQSSIPAISRLAKAFNWS